MGATNNHPPVEIDPQALEHARKFWGNFGMAIKYGIIAIVVLLAGMAFFLV